MYTELHRVISHVQDNTETITELDIVLSSLRILENASIPATNVTIKSINDTVISKVTNPGRTTDQQVLNIINVRDRLARKGFTVRAATIRDQIDIFPMDVAINEAKKNVMVEGLR